VKSLSHIDGTTVTINTVSGNEHGNRYVVKGGGIPNINDKSKNTRGDLIIITNIHIPTDINDDELMSRMSDNNFF